MRWGILLLWTAASAATLTAIGTTAGRAAQARQEAAAATQELLLVRERSARLQQLREMNVEGAATSIPLAQRVNDALAAAGLPQGTLSSLSPESATMQRATPTGPAMVRKRATLTLAPIALPQVGKFLAEWRTQEPDWSVASVDLSPDGGKVVPTGGDLPLRAVVVIETVTPADASQTRTGALH